MSLLEILLKERMLNGFVLACKVYFMFPKHRNVHMAREQAGLPGDRERMVVMMMGSLGREAQLDSHSREGTGRQSTEHKQHLPV